MTGGFYEKNCVILKKIGAGAARKFTMLITNELLWSIPKLCLLLKAAF